jgi:hypothetical protein
MADTEAAKARHGARDFFHPAETAAAIHPGFK